MTIIKSIQSYFKKNLNKVYTIEGLEEEDKISENKLYVYTIEELRELEERGAIGELTIYSDKTYTWWVQHMGIYLVANGKCVRIAGFSFRYLDDNCFIYTARNSETVFVVIDGKIQAKYKDSYCTVVNNDTILISNKYCTILRIIRIRSGIEVARYEDVMDFQIVNKNLFLCLTKEDTLHVIKDGKEIAVYGNVYSFKIVNENLYYLTYKKDTIHIIKDGVVIAVYENVRDFKIVNENLYYYLTSKRTLHVIKDGKEIAVYEDVDEFQIANNNLLGYLTYKHNLLGYITYKDTLHIIKDGKEVAKHARVNFFKFNYNNTYTYTKTEYTKEIN